LLVVQDTSFSLITSKKVLYIMQVRIAAGDVAATYKG
jgi:hypothetical protein